MTPVLGVIIETDYGQLTFPMMTTLAATSPLVTRLQDCPDLLSFIKKLSLGLNDDNWETLQDWCHHWTKLGRKR